MAHPQRIACVFLLSSGNAHETVSEGLLKLAEACGRFTPQIAIRKNEAIFLEVGRSLHLFSETTLRARIEILAKRLGLLVRVSFAQTASLSLAKVYFSEFEKTESYSKLPMDAGSCFSHPFELNLDAQKKVIAFASTLKALGIHTMEDFLHLPVQSLGSRFGEVATRVYSALKGEFEPAWPQVDFSSRIEEKIDFDHESLESSEATLEWVLFPLKNLMDRAMTRVKGLSQRASRVFIELEVASWSIVKNPIRKWEIDLPLPQGTSQGILPIIREYLSFHLAKEPLLAPLKSLKFQVLETVPGRGSQKDFFYSKEIEEESWDLLLGRLLARLGEQSVFHAQAIESYCPEKSWNRTLLQVGKKEIRIRQSGYEQRESAKRPTRLLKEPEPLSVGPGVMRLPSGKTWRVKAWEGPERILTQWWISSPSESVNREYYQVFTQENELLWVYFDRKSSPPQAFLHGYFD